jgi:hypothetical protein
MTHTKITITPVTVNLTDLVFILANCKHAGLARFLQKKWFALLATTPRKEVDRIINECRGAA